MSVARRYLFIAFVSAFAWPLLAFEHDKFPVLRELAVTFKLKARKREAEDVLKAYNLPFREGADSSRGKLYYYNTGPKFILHVPKDRLGEVTADLKKHPLVFEVYEPDWTKQKD